MTWDPTELVLSLEDRFPVDTWRYADFPVWPVLRPQIWVACRSALAARERSPVLPVAPGRLAKAASRVGYARLRRQDREHDARLGGPAGIVALTGGGFDRVLGPRGWYDRHFDYLTGLAAARGLTCLRLDPHHVYRTPRDGASVYVEPHLDRIRVGSMLPGRSTSPRLAGFEALRREAESWDFDVPSLRPERLARKLRYVNRAGSYFRRILDRAAPRLVFVLDWNPASLAMHLAGHRAGVTSVELQHGLHDRSHPFYGAWNVRQFPGVSLFPDVYWTWDARPESIPDWALDGGAHRTRVGGSLELEGWLDTTSQFASRFTSALPGPADPEVGALRVLVTLQPGHTHHERLRVLLEAMSRSPEGWVWWVRHHPTMREEERRAAETALRATGASLEVSSATDLPLAAVLRHVSAHLTVSSSVVFEARAFGVRSVLLPSPYDDVGFGPERADGWAVDADTAAGVLDALTLQAGRRGKAAPPSGRPGRLLDELLARG